MTSLTQPQHTTRSALRSTGVLGLSFALTVAVLVGLASLVETWV